MITENLSTLKIHKLTQEQYDRELAKGTLDANALYLTPEEEIDLSGYATIEQLNGKADTEHTHDNYLSTTGTAAKATADASGNVITDTYATKSALNELSSLVGDTPVSDQITDAISDISFVDINLEDAESGTPTGINADTLGGYPPEYFLGNGGGTSEHNHDDIYYTETEIDAKIAEIDGKFSEINASVANIVSGTTTVDNATKAVQDANGNVIADTYATKAYIEELIGGIENGTY